MSTPRVAFILGAGFNSDAGEEVGRIHVEKSLRGPYDFECRYPLTADLPGICYPKEPGFSAEAIEQHFQDSLGEGDLAPLHRLYDRLSWADFHLVPRLLSTAGPVVSSYRRFFDRFPAADFITFNYDSFVEAFLLALGRWNPLDGYGLTVKAALPQLGHRPPPSASLVLHLHGTPCVYTSALQDVGLGGPKERRLVARMMPEYHFDPGKSGALFLPYEGFGTPQEPGFHEDADHPRVIAPVPDKAHDLAISWFLQEVRAKARAVIERADSVVSIGCRYNPSDRCSYGLILEALASGASSTLKLVAPDAEDTVARLSREFDASRLRAHEGKFVEWAEQGFPL